MVVLTMALLMEVDMEGVEVMAEHLLVVLYQVAEAVALGDTTVPAVLMEKAATAVRQYMEIFLQPLALQGLMVEAVVAAVDLELVRPVSKAAAEVVPVYLDKGLLAAVALHAAVPQAVVLAVIPVLLV
jgi:hypothetical protein